jgi:hypothetical protein
MGCTVVLALRHALLGGHGALGEIADHVVGELVAALDLTLGLVGPVCAGLDASQVGEARRVGDALGERYLTVCEQALADGGAVRRGHSW